MKVNQILDHTGSSRGLQRMMTESNSFGEGLLRVWIAQMRQQTVFWLELTVLIKFCIWLPHKIVLTDAKYSKGMLFFNFRLSSILITDMLGAE